jgi:hypothetical protein
MFRTFFIFSNTHDASNIDGAIDAIPNIPAPKQRPQMEPPLAPLPVEPEAEVLDHIRWQYIR